MHEYMVKILKPGTAFKTEKIEENLTDGINAIAREGWRVVSASDYNGYVLVTFERESNSSLPSF